jgi:hypothetical protein
MKKPEYTWEQVWCAMEMLYPEYVARAKELKFNQVTFFTTICVRCFVDGRVGPDVDTLRSAYKELETLAYLG